MTTEHVFGKQKRMYCDGRTKERTTARAKKPIEKKKTSPRALKARAPNQANPVDMGRGGKKLGGARKAAALDPREARLKALAARGLC